MHRKSVGINDSSLSIQITQTTEQIKLLDRQLFHTELEMANLVTCLHSVIMTIPGIKSTNGGMILGEIGDIHRFSTLGKLLVFSGLNPFVYQSGNFQVKTALMSKRGPISIALKNWTQLGVLLKLFFFANLIYT